MIYRIKNLDDFEKFKEEYKVVDNRYLSLHKQIVKAIKFHGELPQRMLAYFVCESGVDANIHDIRIMTFAVELEEINDQD